MRTTAPVASEATAAAIRRVAASHTTRGHRKNFAARVIPIAAATTRSRSRKRHASAAASANQSVTLPVWMAEMTGGHSNRRPKQRQSRTPMIHGTASATATRIIIKTKPATCSDAIVDGIASSAGSGG